MSNLLDVVGELVRSVPPAEPDRVDRQRSALMAAIRAEQASEEAPKGPAPGRAGSSLLGNMRPRPAMLIGGIAAAIAAVLVVTLVVVPGLDRPTSAAAAVLEQAAATAGQSTALGPGQFLYVETQSHYEATAYRPGSTPGQLDRVATATFGETIQNWSAAGHPTVVSVASGALAFPSAADQAAWNANVSPSVAGTTTNPLLREQGNSQLLVTTSPVDVADLPTDPSQLATELASGQLGTTQHILNGSDAVVERATRLLLGPTSGMTPALASALFQVLANQPGSQLLGTVTDHNGQQGQGVVFRSPGTTGVSEVIVDPQRGQLLEVDYAPPSTSTPAPCITNTSSGTPTCASRGSEHTRPLWVDVVAHGVVGSTTATVPATGSATITATQVPGAPRNLAATVQNGTVELSWSQPADTGASPVTSYRVYTGIPGHGLTSPIATSVTTTLGVTVYELPSGPVVTFAVQAVNAQGYGPLSAAVTVTP